MSQTAAASALAALPSPHDSAYLSLAREVLEQGDRRMDRTGVGTLSLFGAILRLDISQSFPALTTKRVAWKTAIREMLWFLSGDTRLRPLLAQGVHIWSEWPHAAYCRATGDDLSLGAFEQRVLEDDAFAQRWGDLGPVYGKQWRRWAGPDGREYDQIGALLRMLRENPTSRRMLFHGWNVADLDAMLLPPCHLLYQFHVVDGRLSCLLYQRSADVFLGLPFNLAGAAALVAMLAQQSGLVPGRLVWVGGDVHVYLNHIEALRTQLQRAPRAAPRLTLRQRAGSIDGYDIKDFTLSGYDPHPAIHGDVAV